MRRIPTRRQYFHSSLSARVLTRCCSYALSLIDTVRVGANGGVVLSEGMKSKDDVMFFNEVSRTQTCFEMSLTGLSRRTTRNRRKLREMESLLPERLHRRLRSSRASCEEKAERSTEKLSIDGRLIRRNWRRSVKRTEWKSTPRMEEEPTELGRSSGDDSRVIAERINYRTRLRVKR